MEGENGSLSERGLTRNLSSRFEVNRVAHEIPEIESDDKSITIVHSAENKDESPSEKATKLGVHFSVGENQNQDTEEKLHDAHSTEGYSTHNIKSFRNVETMERVPHIDHYRNIMSIEGAIATRPTLAQLHEESPEDMENTEGGSEMPESQAATELALEEFRLREGLPATPAASGSGATKFGWIQGVFVRCLLNILGVMLYLRLSWVAGQAGLLLGSLIVLLSAVVTTLTSLSMCAISTNGDIKGGGCYFMISRSLGPEFGGSIGLIFAFANAVGAAMYVVGFAETVRDIMKEEGVMILDNGMNDIRIIGLITICLLMGIIFIGTGFESKMQVGLLGILIISVINYLIGLMLPLKDSQRARGITGFSGKTISTNMLPEFRGETFFSVFSVFFPAATGIMAGANISGDLSNPGEAIPKGTLLAIFVTTIIYLTGIWFTGGTCMRDASGFLTQSDSIISNNNSASTIMPFISQLVPCGGDVGNVTCEYGLMNYFQVGKKLE